MTLAIALAAAAWLGIVTSISPCPLATNIAAVSYLGRRLESRRLATWGVLSYASGRALTYAVIGVLIALGIAAAPQASMWMQQYISPFVGPILVFVGLILLGWIPLRLSFSAINPDSAEGLARRGLAGAFILGVLFALTFCPISAALFFGSLLPLAIATDAQLPVFVVYGLATALPVGALALLVVVGAGSATRVLSNVQRWQGRIQSVTAWIILAVGAYLTLSGPMGLI